MFNYKGTLTIPISLNPMLGYVMIYEHSPPVLPDSFSLGMTLTSSGRSFSKAGFKVSRKDPTPDHFRRISYSQLVMLVH